MKGISAVDSLVKMVLEDFATLGKSEGIHPDETFYVERHFLSSYLECDVDHIGVRNDGLGNLNTNGKPCVCYILRVEPFRCGSNSPNHKFIFSYFGGRSGHFGPGHGLMITDEDGNILYWRNVDQNPETEWIINEMANDITDDAGNIIFDGEPCNI